MILGEVFRGSFHCLLSQFFFKFKLAYFLQLSQFSLIYFADLNSFLHCIFFILFFRFSAGFYNFLRTGGNLILLSKFCAYFNFFIFGDFRGSQYYGGEHEWLGLINDHDLAYCVLNFTFISISLVSI